MEFFTTSAGISVHVWDTKDERCRVKPGMTEHLTPASDGHLTPADDNPVTPGSDPGSIVLLHGYLETMYVFNELVEALKEHYRVIVIDMPGHGLTDSAPADAEGNRINSLEFQAKVVAGVLDKCGVEKAVIAGHSLGGYVTIQFIKDFPERAVRAVLLHSHPYPDAPEKSKDRQREKDLITEGKLLSIAALSIPKMYYEENLRACDEKIRETVELCETHDPEGIKSSIDGLRTRPDNQAVLQHLPVPLTLVYGDHDNFLPLETVAKMKESFPDVDYVLIPGTGHNSFIEKTDEVVRFFDSLTTRSC